MRAKGPKANIAITTRKGGSPLHFMRILKYARPSFRYLYPGLFCIVIFAMTYSLNLLALLPVVKLMADDQSLPAWVDQTTCEKRMGFLLAHTEGKLTVVATKGKKSLPECIRDRDILVRVDGEPVEGWKTLRALSRLPAGAKVTLETRRPLEDAVHTCAVTLKPVAKTDELLRQVASVLPEETTTQAKMRTLFMVLGVILTITIIGGICRFFGEYLIAFVAGRTVVAIRRKMYDRVLKFPVSYFATRGVSDTISRFVQDSQDIYRGLNFVFAKSLREPLKAMFAFMVALFLDWRITLATIIIAPLAGLLIRKFGKMIRRANKGLLEGYGRMLSALESALNGIRVVKGYRMENYERKHLHAVDAHMLKQQMKIERTDALTGPAFELMGVIVASVGIVYFAAQMFANQMDFAYFATIAACMAGMFDPVRKMSSFYNRIQQANAAVDRVFEIIDLPIEEERKFAAAPLPPLADRIEFKNVRFTYAGTDRPALDGVNLVVRRGERIAFVGPNGSGKTTMLAMLMRFFEPDEGSVTFDGRNVRDFSIHSLRRQISLITQDTVIFADTIAHNIAYGDDRLLRRMVLRRRHPERFPSGADPDFQRIVSAATAAYADEFIREKPKGYDTDVGEHGAQLSGGQKQRIAIARAILRNAPIFIFDEATSQIDSESEQKIHDAVEKFLEGRTALIIAHRFSTILQADRIVVLDRGRIVDMGRHEELMERCRLYQTLYGSQILDDAKPGPVPVGTGA
ncbi:MAG: hypothetical protein DCC65_00235 [Planctomycetota bacterium]|nr:MAG: hypothetical protein DCC65_00235 [Planctomycetota bacterium]